MISHIALEAILNQHSKEHFNVLLLGPNPDSQDSHLGKKRDGVRDEIKKTFEHANVKCLVDSGIQEHLKKTGKDYLQALLEDYAPIIDLFFFFLGEHTEGTFAEIEALGYNPAYRPYCYAIFDSDQCADGDAVVGGNTYSSRIRALVRKSHSVDCFPASIDGMSRGDIIDCQAWACIRLSIRAFLSLRALERRKKGR